MKLTTIFIFAGLMQLSAAGLAQKVTLNERNAALESVMNKIRLQTGFEFVFKADDVDKAKRVTLTVQGEALESALEKIFENQELSYSIEDKFIVLKPKKKSYLETVIARFQSIDVRGKVVDSLGNGLPGATVSVKRLKQSTQTAGNGDFYLKNVEQGAVLVVSYLGYVTKEQVANKDFNYVILKENTSQLDEIQVIAYGKTSKRLTTGNISSISSTIIEKQPVTNPVLALSGQVPGVYIQQSTGLPGSGVVVRIQGTNSLGRGNDPLYIIDGVQYPSQPLYSSNAIQGNSGGSGNVHPSGSVQSGNPMDLINPADIESISVLKDADATAIYGAKAANGAILVTTKKGKAGSTRVNLNFQTGRSEVGKFQKLLNTEQYITARLEGQTNDNSPVGEFDYDINGFWDKNAYTDWQKLLLGKKAPFTDAQLSISGGNAQTQYRLGLGYNSNETVFIGSNVNKKYSINLAVNGSQLNDKLKFEFTSRLLHENFNLPTRDFTFDAVFLAPNAPPLYDVLGSVNWAPDKNGRSSFASPASFLLPTSLKKTTNIFNTINLSYSLVPEIKFLLGGGANLMYGRETSTNPLSAQIPDYRQYFTNNAGIVNSSFLSFSLEPQIAVKKAIGRHQIDALLGFTYQNQVTDLVGVYGQNYPSDDLLKNFSSAATFGSNLAANTLYKYSAIFGRINYSIADRYFINATLRRDGSTRFGNKTRFHNFAAIGAAWNFTEESFLNNKIPELSFGKLRGSFGTTGSDQVGDYIYMDLLNVYAVPVPYQGVTALAANRIANPYFGWEETQKLQFGVDLGFFKDRILISANKFDNRTRNQIVSQLLPTITGFGSFFDNLPAVVQNQGFEFELNTSNLAGKVKWSTGVNFTTLKNKLKSFDNIESSIAKNQFKIGEPITGRYFYKNAGVDPATGLELYYDANGTISTVAKDLLSFVNLAPTISGGLRNTVEFKNFSLDVLIQFVKRRGLIPLPPTGSFNSNFPTWLLRRWRNNGDVADFVRFSSTNSVIANGQNDLYVQDASFARLKNLSIGYSFDKSILKKLKIESLKFFAQGQNLLTITTYKGWDPESAGSLNALPPLRTMTIGLNVGF